MKKTGFFSISFLLFFISAMPSFAQTITTGDQTAQTSVTNTINNGSVTSHTETTVNGQTTIIDSNGPGSVNIKNVNGNITISKTPEVTIAVTQKPASSTPTVIPDEEPASKSFISDVFENIKSFLKRLFNN